MPDDVINTKLRLDEIKAIIGTMIDQPAEQVEDWLIIAKLPCGNCGREYCADGQLITLGSRTGSTENGTLWRKPAFELHLLAKLIDNLSEEWAAQ